MTGGPALVCVSGLAAEARIARRSGFSAVVGAGDRGRTKALVAAAIAGADCLVSFGISGALSAALRPGDLILSAEIVSARGSWQGDPAWRRRLGALAQSIGAASAPVIGADGVLATRADKERAYQDFGAHAVDLESDIVARAAAAADIPFAALRAIADPVERDLPRAALIRLAADGRPDLVGVFASVLRRPRQIEALFALLGETQRALRALARAAPVLHSFAAG
jgi:adenosylhomocysteine nucleosidase